MMRAPDPSLSGYLLELQAKGQVSFTRDEAVKRLRVTETAFLKSAKRLEKREIGRASCRERVSSPV